MFLLRYLFTAALASMALGAAHPCINHQGIPAARKSQVKAAFAKYSIAPGVVAPSIDPLVDLEASYPAGAVNLGNVFQTART